MSGQLLLREANVADVPGVVLVDGREGLSALHRPGCGAAIWERALPRELLRWIDGLDAARLPRGRVALRPGDAAAALAAFCDAAGTPDCAERAWLMDDITALVGVFAALTGAPWLRLRLDVVTTNACRRFHVDAVTARLICTYRGTGTQYGTRVGTADPARVHTVPTGAPVALRGSHAPAEPSVGLVHRSPPIEGTGAARLLLVLDPLDGPETEA